MTYKNDKTEYQTIKPVHLEGYCGNHISSLKMYWKYNFLLFTLIFCLLDMTCYLKGRPSTGRGSRSDTNEKILTGDKFQESSPGIRNLQNLRI